MLMSSPLSHLCPGCSLPSSDASNADGKSCDKRGGTKAGGSRAQPMGEKEPRMPLPQRWELGERKPELRPQQVLRGAKEEQGRAEPTVANLKEDASQCIREDFNEGIKEQEVIKKKLPHSSALIGAGAHFFFFLSPPSSVFPTRILIWWIISSSCCCFCLVQYPPFLTTAPPWKPGAPGRYSSPSPCWTPTWTQRQLSR